MERLDEKNISIFSLLKYEKVKIFIGVLLGIFSGVLSFTPLCYFVSDDFIFNR